MTSSQSSTLTARIERWPIAGSFTISRGAKTEAVTVVAEVSRGGHAGRGECVPYPRYGESPEATLAALQAMREPLSRGLDRKALQTAMPPGAARNALDCALLDLEAKTRGRRVWDLLGRPEPGACITAYTISLASPEAMAAAAAQAAHRPLLKIKLGGDGDGERIAAVRQAACRLRRRKRARSDIAGGTARTLRCRQYQARQDRRTDRGAGDGRCGARLAISNHDRLHGRDLAGDGAGDVAAG